jgi:restriction endonuclease
MSTGVNFVKGLLYGTTTRGIGCPDRQRACIFIDSYKLNIGLDGRVDGLEEPLCSTEGAKAAEEYVRQINKMGKVRDEAEVNKRIQEANEKNTRPVQIPVEIVKQIKELYETRQASTKEGLPGIEEKIKECVKELFRSAHEEAH